MSFQYQRLADQLAHKIYQHELQPQQKLSSLREFARQQEVSLSTAQQCYELLEAKGLIYVKAKSGYFVSPRQYQSAIPDSPQFESMPRQVSNLDLQNQIQTASIQSHLTPLGAIQLSPHLIPVDGLRRSLQRALKHCQPEDFLYCNKQGHMQLRQALSDHWREDGIYVAIEDIFITNGCMPALSLLIQQMTKEGDSILIPTPTFNGQLQMLAGLKRKIIEIPADHQGIDLERLESFMRQGAAKLCLLTANFQNPSGYCLSNEQKQHIAQLAEKYQCFILEDDIYGECSFQKERPLPIRYWDQQGYVIWCGSVSKSLSSAYRVGWFCLGQQLQHLRPQLMANNVGVNTPLQLGLADFIYSRGYREHLERLRPKLMQQVEQYRAYILEAFQGLPIALSQSEGGYALWLQLPKSISGLELYYLAQAKGINIVPGEVFGEDKRYQHFVRLNAGHALTEEIRQALQQLADWVRKSLH
ncbi:GntR family transcriptional regulator [Acinetobacter sp. COS3]|uniref:Putative HTH-type transcriptional regulator YdcR n=2 Tax=Acinetobacter TaxID=469 RepID=A0A150I2M0_9GAMM|nr:MULTISPECIES: PLP-dependent aminotransferase family protein [Acinetobacter]ERS03483.1 GntR family transcriptional regulator [Acinetobacter sp. COS3]KXO79985.1 GntR family transcriptional regulator [Acinetobacter venetianus]KXO85324.1 GntR family transcriptional regulator [Acinetobacter venetianus]KXZ73517.1 putative HTH-type transcriptional regulator YdcR [Acinetobacter venetianus]MBC68273.1 PLP-dependent aminotransferase family protein [Acinetobacter sp.]